jgi:hypothetical protein
MPKLTQYQRDAIDLMRARLDPSHPGFTGAECVRDALSCAPPYDNAGLYIRSWVLPLLDLIENGESYRGEAQSVAFDAARANAAKRNAELVAASSRARAEAAQRDYEDICFGREVRS